MPVIAGISTHIITTRHANGTNRNPLIIKTSVILEACGNTYMEDKSHDN